MRRVTKLAAVVLSGSLGIASLAACGSTSDSGTKSGASSSASAGSGSSGLKVGMAYDIGGRGDQSFNDSAARGLDQAKQELGAQVKELSAGANETDADKTQRLKDLAEAGYNPIIAIGYIYAGPLDKVAKQYPNTKFAIVDSTVDAPNVTNLVFTEEQSSYLAGVAAAVKSKTHKVGFIGGVNVPLINKFEAGFTAGVKATDPSAKVTAQYLSQPPDSKGFTSPDLGKAAAQGMLDKGIDVIYAAAGSSGNGAIEAAAAKKAWAIGVDSDQYKQDALAKNKDAILTSALKNVDVSVLDYIKSFKDGSLKTGTVTFDLKNNGVGYSTSNPAFSGDAALVAKVEEAKKAIIDGKVTPPTTVK
ncbi:BMP family lipoprotein [Peterkaempfera bronchialis]|uniref:BMP family ABC transporter substrate-binding protein n=1 Tax=Peterkaempfera bronchialis TaxID=2126346 RepID=A0A345SW09_9ACTN|nr:BMP family ABC transporter substrate-binding protein [Peterkaempfera bronchialis]AXI77914.1 BMP family ABC transporter substrate-binding protein [Peterkaempfera bronchialis]